MTARNAGATAPARTADAPRASILRRLPAETKHAFKTTEFWATLAVCAGILIAAAVIDGDGDTLVARDAWLYVAILVAGYAISRGLAKAGSYAPPDLSDRDLERGP